MTNSLLDVSRFEAGRMPVRRSVTDLSALVRSVVTAVRILQPTRDIAVETHGDSVSNCDPELTRRVIENLVSNAMKHTPIAGQVRVVTSSSRNRAYIAVHDEGPVLSPEKRNRIFEPYSADGLRSTTGYESSGGLGSPSAGSRSRRRAVQFESRTARHMAASSSSNFPAEESTGSTLGCTAPAESPGR
jgi:two-component system, chemotaxis family, CheB/CheR fusion protein